MADELTSWTDADALEDFLQGVPCGLLSCAADGTILAVNDTFLDWTGYTRSQLVKLRHFDELLTLPCRIYYETHFRPLLGIQGFVHEVALDVRRHDGAALPALVSTTARPQLNGAPGVQRVAVFAARDRRAYERELLLARRASEEAVKAKADFLAMFAHEIRNPLTVVLLEAETLERGGACDASDPTLPQLRESLDRVLKLLNNMLDISKLEAGKASLQQSEFEIGDVVQAVVHSLRPLADARDLPVSVHVDSNLRRRVVGDPMKLDQALTNLVGNAIKFTETGSVRIDADRVEERGAALRVRFGVEDTGIGIARERQACIFEEYEQADASVAHRFGGTGLGLAITRKLVELLGGRLAVVSEPGRGSRFSFELTFEAR